MNVSLREEGRECDRLGNEDALAARERGFLGGALIERGSLGSVMPCWMAESTGFCGCCAFVVAIARETLSPPWPLSFRRCWVAESKMADSFRRLRARG